VDLGLAYVERVRAVQRARDAAAAGCRRELPLERRRRTSAPLEYLAENDYDVRWWPQVTVASTVITRNVREHQRG
jgi:hypothetical protein